MPRSPVRDPHAGARRYLTEVHERYGLPVWLTEFSCGDGAAGRPTADHLAYMKLVVPRLEAAPHVCVRRCPLADPHTRARMSRVPGCA